MALPAADVLIATTVCAFCFRQAFCRWWYEAASCRLRANRQQSWSWKSGLGQQAWEGHGRPWHSPGLPVAALLRN